MKIRLMRPLAAALLGGFLAHPLTAFAAPTVTPMADGSTASAAALVNSLLAPASGLTLVAGSASYIGAPTASGTFIGGGTGPTGVGMDSGVVLTTGDARFLGSSAAFAGDNANKTGDFTAGVLNSLTPNNSPGNALFNSLTSFGTANASILGFQFIPQDSFLRLSFVFASEDYNDLVNSGFPTDVFGIFVNGVNYALVPGSSSPISASSVNCGGPTSGPAPGGGQNCASYRDNAPFFGCHRQRARRVHDRIHLAGSGERRLCQHDADRHRRQPRLVRRLRTPASREQRCRDPGTIDVCTDGGGLAGDRAGGATSAPGAQIAGGCREFARVVQGQDCLTNEHSFARF